MRTFAAAALALGLAVSASAGTKPALKSLMSAAGVDDLKTVAVAAPSVQPVSALQGERARITFECMASPWGYGFSEILFLAQTQACFSCRGSGKPCQYQCYERVGNRPLPFPVSRGFCD